MIITYIDSGVLLSATNGTSLIAEKALEILSDSHRVFAAFSVGAEDLITTEKKTKPMHKVVGIKVISIFD